MAVHLATVADYLKRTTGLLPASGDSTVCYWLRIPVISVAPGYQIGYVILDNPAVYSDYAGMFFDTLNNDLHAVVAGVDAAVSATPLVANTWVHLAWTQTGTTQRYYVNAALIGSTTKNRAAVVDGFELIGNDTFSDGDVDVAYVREWTAALTQAQILDEMQALTASHTANLYMDCPLSANLLDTSGNGHNWTQVGSGSFVSGPSFPSNHTAATATAISTTLPNTITQDFQDGIIAWYSYTPTLASPNMLGFWAFTNVTDALETASYTGSPSSLTLQASGTARPQQLPLDVGTTWYLRVLMTTNHPPTAVVSISSVPGPTQTVSAGDLMIPTDASVYRAAVVGGDSISYAVKSFIDIPPCNQGDSVNTAYLFSNDDIGQFEVFDSSFARVGNLVPSTVGSRSVRAHLPTQKFYVGMAGSGATHASVRTIDATATYGATTWTLAAAGLRYLAANNDETILYYTATSAANAAIKRWDLTNNIALADFVAGVAGFQVFDLYVLSDGSILVARYNTATFVTTVIQYNAAGATLNTYTGTNHGTDFRITPSLTDTVSFYRWSHTGGISTIEETKISDGSALNTQTQAEYEASVYSSTPAPTATPFSRFGLSNTCPIVLVRAPAVPPPVGEPVEYLIRRERWFPHLNNEQMRQFFSFLQIDLQAGNGITTGQGSDPIMEIDWSDDGGWTWSSIRFVHTGKIGAYTQRAITRRLGYSRDRIFRIAVSDPNQWVVISGYLQAVLGSS